MDIMKPVVNLNGTSPEELVRQRQGVLEAIQTLEQELMQAGPHPRDYPGNAELYEQAMQIHKARVELVSQMREAVTEEAMRILDQEEPSSSPTP